MIWHCPTCGHKRLRAPNTPPDRTTQQISVRAERYDLVVKSWKQTVEVAKAHGVTATSVLASVHREFRERYRDVWKQLELLRKQGDDPYSATTPYLWMLRFYERFRVVPTIRGQEGWGRLGPDDLKVIVERNNP